MNLEPEEIQIINIMSKLHYRPITDEKTKSQVLSEYESILKEYYLENISGIKGKMTTAFKSSGITEDEGKTALACGRRLGMNFIA